MTNLSPDAKPASGPVKGVMKPILIVPVEEEFPEPLMPELHAARMPPAPVASAPAPKPRSTDRPATPCSCGGLSVAPCRHLSRPLLRQLLLPPFYHPPPSP